MKPAPLIGALALAAFLVRRRSRLEPPFVVGGAIAVALMTVYGSGVIELPNVEKLIEDAGEVLGHWTYLVVALLAFLETGAFVGLIAPGETVILLGGVIAGQGRIDLLALIAIVWSAAVAGDVTSFMLGRRLGRGFLERHGPRFHITAERLVAVEAFFDHHGGKAILVGRFVGLVRAIAPFLAGASGMALRRFLPYDIVGAGLWGSTFVVLGYFFWRSFGTVVDYAEKGALALGTVIVVVLGTVVAVRWLRVTGNRARASAALRAVFDRPALRPLVVVIGPVWRIARRPLGFARARLTPGGLGLELTTLLAVLLVGAFVFGGLLVTLGNVRFTHGDIWALGAAADLRDPRAVDVAQLLTAIGAFPVVCVVVVGAAGLLAWRRRWWLDAATLIAGFALTYAGVHLTKAAEGRDRPQGPLVDVAGSSFPSGHTAYSVALVAVAVLTARALPGLVRGATLVLGAVVAVAVVAATRVYLRAHFLSDVLAGAGLGAAAFALCGIAAMIVARVRQNASAS